jgi:hypothetical protein
VRVWRKAKAAGVEARPLECGIPRNNKKQDKDDIRTLHFGNDVWSRSSPSFGDRRASLARAGGIRRSSAGCQRWSFERMHPHPTQDVVEAATQRKLAKADCALR